MLNFDKKVYTYNYSGPIYKFEKLLDNSVSISTQAPNLTKAKSNIIYIIKRKLNLDPETEGININDNNIKRL